MHRLTWDIDRVLVYIPFTDFPIYWYGLFFALGFYLAQKVVTRSLKKDFSLSHERVQNIILLVALFVVAGARLFDVIFYQDFQDFLAHPWKVFRLRGGGLASHGGAVGYLVSLYIGARSLKIPFVSILARTMAPFGIMAGCIRIGNFFNQEILGKVYYGLFSVTSLNPIDGSYPVPRHPVVLYEALVYFMGFLIFYFVKMEDRKKVGLSIIYYSSLRAAIELFKQEQSVHNLPGFLTMGMLLSIPAIGLGVLVLCGLFSPKKPHTISQSEHPKGV